MKKILVTILLGMLFLTTLAYTVQTSSASSKVTIEDLVKDSAFFKSKQVSIEGYLVIEEIYEKQSMFSLRDEKGHMVKLQFTEPTDVSAYAGKKMDITGYFEIRGQEATVTVYDVKPLEAGAPTQEAVTGEQKTMVLMGYFTDRMNTLSYGNVYRTVFNDMGGYYAAESYDLMYVSGSWNPWVQLSHTVGYYGYTNPSWWFIRDLVAKVDSTVNFAGYSRFIFVNAGPNEETSGNVNDIWSARWSGLSIATNDGVTITHGAIVPDKEAGSNGILGVFCHEYGHELGLPDLYTYPSDIEEYDLMDMGSWNNNGNTPSGFTSYSKNSQGWIMSQQIHTTSMGAEYLRLDPLEDPAATISVIKVPYGSHYYFIEARRKVGFDAYLPAERVLVLWINATSNRPYLRASLDVGGQYESGNFGIKVMSSDLEGWSYNVYVWNKSWSADIRLTNAASESNTNWGHTALATVSYNVYATWDDYRNGNWEIYFKRSTTWGSSWLTDVRITNNAANSWYPSIAAYGSYVYIAWQDYRNGNWEIYFRRSENYGVSWPYGDQRLTSNNMTSTRPSVAVYGRYVYVVWEDNRDGNPEIYFKRSTDNGLTWGSDTRLTSNTAGSYLPNVAAYGTYVHVVWEDYRSGNWDIRYRRSTNYGASWGTDTGFTTNTAEQRFPSIAAWGYDVYVTWTDYRYGAANSEIYLRRSLSSGSSFYTEQRLTSYSYLSSFAVVACKGKAVYVVWQDNRTGTWEVYIKESPNRGLYWTNDRRLSATPYTSQWPSITVGGADWEDVYVVWTDYRNTGNSEIYFKYRW